MLIAASVSCLTVAMKTVFFRGLTLTRILTLNGARKKVTPIMLLVNVRSIRRWSVNVKEMIFTLNAMT